MNWISIEIFLSLDMFKRYVYTQISNLIFHRTPIWELKFDFRLDNNIKWGWINNAKILPLILEYYIIIDKLYTILFYPIMTHLKITIDELIDFLTINSVKHILLEKKIEIYELGNRKIISLSRLNGIDYCYHHEIIINFKLLNIFESHQYAIPDFRVQIIKKRINGY